ncbi:uncharacterized protein LOC113229267, partial [Hyposmocoma kahamanoa]|uniref:uncharacterized protein LOC113229267 n=1 Tax=Hyposmocoma kahamanoa TaxID=1477025 RepID=UPI000E6D926B
PIQSMHGEFDCVLEVDPNSVGYSRLNSIQYEKLCQFRLNIVVQNPDINKKGCEHLLQNLYISGVPDIDNWEYEDDGEIAKCKGTLKYSSPLWLKLGCHRKTDHFLFNYFAIYDSDDIREAAFSVRSDNLLDILLYPDHNWTIQCGTKFESSVVSRVIVQFQYKATNTLPVENRLNLENSILFEIKTSDNGNFCDASTNITIKEGPFMIKIFGNYEQVNDIWCRINGSYGELFLTTDDFLEYEHPKEAVAVVGFKKNGYMDVIQSTCKFLMFPQNGAQIHQDNANYFEKMTCTASVRVIGAEENTLLFNLKNDNTECDSVEPTQNFTIKEGSILTVKIPNILLHFSQLWCSRVDDNTQSAYTGEKYFKEYLTHKYSTNEAVAAIAKAKELVRV